MSSIVFAVLVACVGGLPSEAAVTVAKPAFPGSPAFYPGVSKGWAGGLSVWLQDGVVLPGLSGQAALVPGEDRTQRLAPLVAAFRELGYRPSRLPRTAKGRRAALQKALARAAEDMESRAQALIVLGRGPVEPLPKEELEARARELERFIQLYGRNYLEDDRLERLKRLAFDTRNRSALAKALSVSEGLGRDLRDAVGPAGAAPAALGARPVALEPSRAAHPLAALQAPARSLLGLPGRVSVMRRNAAFKALRSPYEAEALVELLQSDMRRYGDAPTHRAAIQAVGRRLGERDVPYAELVWGLEAMGLATLDAEAKRLAIAALLRAAEGRPRDLTIVLAHAAERVARTGGEALRKEAFGRLRVLAKGELDLDVAEAIEKVAGRLEPAPASSRRSPLALWLGGLASLALGFFGLRALDEPSYPKPLLLR
ncbi:MAG: hypothetical protein HY554_15520 [Elusimicrobia bacterium]|nr:hypothetical protein [Elusimicrobiota bacterium]